MTRAERQNVWTARVVEFKASGQSVTGWCTAHDVKPHQLWYWLKKSNGHLPGQQTISWLPLDLSEASFGTSLSVRVGQVVVEVKPGFDPRLLLDVVKTLIAQ